MSYQKKIDKLAKLVKESSRTIVLTGAGASTESGIPDFRSAKTGLWEKYNPQEMVSVDALRRDPELFYELNMQWWQGCMEAKPNLTHFSLAELEHMGFVLGIITQNIDSLHQKAGSKRVWEVHGHLRSCHCVKCRREYKLERVKENIYCDCGGLLRPAVILFGDTMAEDFFKAEKAMVGCQLLIVVGSSLQVYPVAYLPQLAKRLVIINHDPTPWDRKAELVFNESSGEVLSNLVEKLEGQKGPFA